MILVWATSGNRKKGANISLFRTCTYPVAESHHSLILHYSKFLLFSYCNRAKVWFSFKDFRDLCCKDDRFRLVDIRIEKVVQVNKACKCYPKVKCVSTQYLLFSLTCWVDSISEKKELLANIITDCPENTESNFNYSYSLPAKGTC